MKKLAVFLTLSSGRKPSHGLLGILRMTPSKWLNRPLNQPIECADEYKKTAARAWEIAALAERKLVAEARKGLREALSQSRGVMPLSSRAEALTLLLQAAIQISHKDAKEVADELTRSCGQDLHWRCKRAIRDAGKFLEGELNPRPFFW